MTAPWKPNRTEIKTRFDKCVEVYSTLFKAFDQDDRFYELGFKEDLEIPAEFQTKGIVLPTARTLVDTYVNHVDIANPVVGISSRQLPNETDENYRSRLKMMKQIGQAFLYANNVLAPIAPLAVSRRHFALHGLTWLKTVYDREIWPGAPSREDYGDDQEYAEALDYWRATSHESVPVVLQAVHPQCVLPDPSFHPFGPGYLFEYHSQMRLDIDALHPGWKNPMGKGPTEYVEYLVFWTPFFRAEYADWEPILEEEIMPHSYGFIPYCGIESGLGNIDKKMAPEKRYVGILRYVRDVLISESRAYSIDDIVLAKNAWPTRDFEGVTEENSKLLQISQKFGEVNKIPAGIKTVERSHPVPPEALRQHLSLTGSYIREHAAPASLMGMPEEGVRSATDRQGIVAKAAQRFAYSEEAYKHGAGHALNKMARILKSPAIVPGTESIWMQTPADEFGVQIDRSRMKEPFNYTVRFNPIDPEADVRLHDLLIRSVAGGLYTVKEARRRIPNLDTDAMEREERKDIQRANIAPVLASYQQNKAQIMVAGVAEAEGFPLIPAVAPEGNGGQPAAAEGLPRRGAAPPSPKPMPNSVEGIVNAQDKLRSQMPMSATQGMGGGGNRG